MHERHTLRHLTYRWRGATRECIIIHEDAFVYTITYSTFEEQGSFGKAKVKHTLMILKTDTGIVRISEPKETHSTKEHDRVSTRHVQHVHVPHQR